MLDKELRQSELEEMRDEEDDKKKREQEDHNRKLIAHEEEERRIQEEEQIRKAIEAQEAQKEKEKIKYSEVDIQ